jgi:hypothetical protein
MKRSAKASRAITLDQLSINQLVNLAISKCQHPAQVPTILFDLVREGSKTLPGKDSIHMKAKVYWKQKGLDKRAFLELVVRYFWVLDTAEEG